MNFKRSSNQSNASENGSDNSTTNSSWASIRSNSSWASIRSNSSTDSLLTRPIGLMNYGNTCFINSAMQCLASLSSLDDFVDDRRLTSQCTETSKSLFLRLLQLELQRLKEPINNVEPLKLSSTFVKIIYNHFGEPFNTQQDAVELLSFLLDDMSEARTCRLYANRFQLQATVGHEGGIGACFSKWCLSVYIKPGVQMCNLTTLLSEAVLCGDAPFCHCDTPDAVHIYGELPKVMIISVLRYDETGTHYRRNFQVGGRERFSLSDGTSYCLKSAIVHVGLDSYSTNPMDENLQETCIEVSPQKKIKTSTPIKSIKRTISSKKLNWNSFKKVFSDDSNIVDNRKIFPATMDRTRNLVGFSEAGSPIVPQHKGAVFMTNSLRHLLPSFNGQSGHYTSYVQRQNGSKWYHVNDSIVSETKSVFTDDIYVYFYEQV